jgi:hypothetical protein
MSTTEPTGADRGEAVMTGAAWRSFCERLAAVGEQLLEPGLPDSPRDRAEGYRHLMNQVACWMTYAVGSSDPLNPLLFRHNDLVYRWGGPNIDQNSRRTVISGKHAYRVSGSMGSCEEFALQVKRGEMHTGDAGVDATLWASELGLGPGDAFTITLSSDPADEPTLLISPNASLLHIRDYYYRWASEEPAEFVLERTDQSGEAPAPLTPERVQDMLEIAATQVESSIKYWIDYQDDLRGETPLNEFSVPGLVAEGVGGMYYAHCFIRLADDEALIIDVQPDEAPHWNLQLYNRAWYESLDFANRLTHTNEALVTRGTDATARIVVSATDPGTANWIDTEGRTEVMATSRWTRPAGVPSISTRVVKLADLPDEGLPPIISAADRQVQIARRRAHVAWRYHT